MSVRLHVISQKDQDIEEIKEIMSSVDHCYFRDPTFKCNEEPFQTMEFKGKVKLLRIKKRTGWIVSKQKQSIFEGLLDKYENNQSYYLLEKDNLSREEVIKGLTDMEKWFVLLIEPHPKLPNKKSDKKVFLDELHQWLKREKFKTIYFRSYYCNDDVIDFLDNKELKEVNEEIKENFKKVECMYNMLKKEHS